MRNLANLFLILFVADGAVSLLDVLVSLVSPVAALGQVRVFLADVVLVLAFTIFQGLAIDQRLPKRVFVPLTLFVCLVPISVLIFPSLSGNSSYGLLAASGQLLLCMLPVYHLQQTNQSGFLMPKAMFDGPFFSLRNTLVFSAITVFVVPLVSVLLLFSTANSFMHKNTAGFMRLAPDGIYMTEKVYRRDSKTIRLIGMIHMGDKQYYDGLAGSVAPGRTIILAEGVSDTRKMLRNRLDYGNFADYLGLTLQQEKMHFKGRTIEAAELEKSLPRSRDGANSTAQIDIMRADVDISSFHPETIRFLDALGKQMKESTSVTKGLNASSSWSKEYMTPQMQKVIMDDILYRRNKEVIRHMRKALVRYDTIVIPWGALHMPEIETEVLKQGFELQHVRERESIDFGKMLHGKS
ncbi:MAG: hypothetical protein A2075_20765 [Geobacteraceae bacterium GWC2_58_44]|nr:MAG: hypothetical protein A2075_20765 [Geobacteraceae bacterium GWC2_58_44]HBG05288.1 hypothetical protein [Geobacter sp.]